MALINTFIQRGQKDASSRNSHHTVEIFSDIVRRIGKRIKSMLSEGSFLSSVSASRRISSSIHRRSAVHIPLLLTKFHVMRIKEALPMPSSAFLNKQLIIESGFHAVFFNFFTRRTTVDMPIIRSSTVWLPRCVHHHVSNRGCCSASASTSSPGSWRPDHFQLSKMVLQCLLAPGSQGFWIYLMILS